MSNAHLIARCVALARLENHTALHWQRLGYPKAASILRQGRCYWMECARQWRASASQALL